MKRLFLAVSALLGLTSATTGASLTLSQVVDSVSVRYDRIESYRADADIFEYDGWARTLTQSTGRYFYKNSESTRLEVGKISGADTLWTVYLGTKPAGCSGDLATSVLVMPVLSAEPLRRWPDQGAAILSETADSCTVAFTDSAGGMYQYLYTIDTRRWLVVRIVKTYYSYEYFNGTYVYGHADGETPMLTSIVLRGDTTLAKGGYRFYNIEINGGLDDSLFVVSIQKGWRGIAGTAATVFDGSLVQHSDLLGRKVERLDHKKYGAGFIIKYGGGRTQSCLIMHTAEERGGGNFR